jgi:hypothetical protein
VPALKVAFSRDLRVILVAVEVGGYFVGARSIKIVVDHPPVETLPGTSQPPPPVASPPGQAAPKQPPETTAGYRSVDTFAVNDQHGAGDARYSAILNRYGLFSWKLVGIELNG